MMRKLSEGKLTITESSFNNQVFEVFDAIKCFPQRVASCRITGKHQTCPAAIELEADRWNRMVRGDWRNFAAIEVNCFTHPDFLVSQKRIGLIRYYTEIRPDFPVEDVILEYLPSVAGGMHRDVLFAHADDGIHQQGDAGDVVEVRMRYEDVVDGHHGIDGKVCNAGARIDQDVVVHQDGGGAQIAADPSAAA